MSGNNRNTFVLTTTALLISVLLSSSTSAQIGRRFPSEKKIVTDPVTGTQLTFLTSGHTNDSKLYRTNRQWTADGKWLIFRSGRVPGETLAVNENSGDIVQVSEGGYMGMLCLAQKSMKLYFLRMVLRQVGQTRGGPVQVVEVDLGKLFADSESGLLIKENDYQKVCGTIPSEIEAGGNLALDADEETVYFRTGKEVAAKHLPDRKGIIVAVPFRISHIQANPRVSGEIMFRGESAGNAPHRTWTIRSDGTDLKPHISGSGDELVTNETIIAEDEAAIPGRTPSGNRFLYTDVSADGRWAVADDFAGNIYLKDRRTHEVILLSSGHKATASEQAYPTFSPDGTRIEIQSAFLQEDKRSKNICIIPVPEEWLKRKY
jgi:oligogalacturonide lyase